MLHQLTPAIVLIDMRGDQRPPLEQKQDALSQAAKHLFEEGKAYPELMTYHMKSIAHGIWIVSKYSLVPMQTRPAALRFISKYPLPT